MNQILSQAIHRTIGSNPNYVPSVEAALKGGAGTAVSQANAKAGDLVIAGNTGHIGIYMGGGRVQSNSSSRACFCWVCDILLGPEAPYSYPCIFSIQNSNINFDGTGLFLFSSILNNSFLTEGPNPSRVYRVN